MVTCVNSIFAESVLESLPTKARFRALRNLLGKNMDSVANLVIKIKNAGAAGHETVTVPFTKLNWSILEKLKQTGYVKSFSEKTKKTFKTIEVEIAYEDGKAKIENFRRVSKLSRRVYEKASNIRPVRRGYGVSIISTPKGVLTDSEARKAHVGGEVLFQIW